MKTVNWRRRCGGGRAGGRARWCLLAAPPRLLFAPSVGRGRVRQGRGCKGGREGGRDGGREVYSQQSGLLKRTVLVGRAQGEGRQGEGSDGARGACQEGQMAWLQDIQSRRW